MHTKRDAQRQRERERERYREMYRESQRERATKRAIQRELQREPESYREGKTHDTAHGTRDTQSERETKEASESLEHTNSSYAYALMYCKTLCLLKHGSDRIIIAKPQILSSRLLSSTLSNTHEYSQVLLTVNYSHGLSHNVVEAPSLIFHALGNCCNTQLCLGLCGVEVWAFVVLKFCFAWC